MATLSAPSSPRYPSSDPPPAPPTPPGSSPSSLVHVPPDPALEAALAGLVADGTLSAEQAHAVRSSRAVLLTRPQATPAPEPVRRHNPLPEIVGYVGAALVGSALLNLVLQTWENWADAARLAFVTGGTAALYVAALIVAATSGWRSGLAHGPAARRRLVALLLAAGAAGAGITTVVVLGVAGYGDTAWTALASGCVAFTAATLGAWFARSVLSTLAVAGGTLWVVAGAFVAMSPADGALWVPLAVTAAAAVWVAVAPRLLAVPVLSEALGWGFAVFMLMTSALWVPPGPGEGYLGPDTYLDAMQTQAWVSRGLLVALAIVGMAAFLRGASWPWAAGGVASGVVAALAIGGQTMNWIVAMLVAGVVLLLLSAILIAARRRSDARHTRETAPPG